MKEKILHFFRLVYRLKDNIAFYPSLIGLAGFTFAYIMFYLEERGISKYLLDVTPQLVINNTETARALLTTFIAGLISIMVFSFTMVMSILSQASSNFSPRLLPGLISNRKHQIVLGCYLASIIYCIIILVYIEPDGNKYQLPGFSVLFAIIAMLMCLAAFIYFIHSISQAIQISNIMEKIFLSSKSRLDILIENEDENDDIKKFEDTKNWERYPSNISGYLQDVSLKNIANIAKETNTRIQVTPVKGTFVLTEDDLFRADKKLDDEQVEKILRLFVFAQSEMIEDNYALAFKQLTEIAVKAMSPGINDPGTAINAIDYLTQLFAVRLRKNDVTYTKIDDEIRASMNTLTFKELLFQVMAALRTYCKHDIIIVQKLLTMLYSLKSICKNEVYRDAIETETEQLKRDAKESIKNERDLSFLKINT